MTQNKFWLVCELNTSDMIFDSEAEAVKKAYNESKDNEYADFYVVEAKWHYKSKSVTVNKVIETQLHEKQSVPVETSFEATPEESLAVEPKYKIGDKVLYEDVCEYFTGKSFWKDGVVIDIIGDQYLKIENKVTTEILTFELDSIMVKLAEPTPEPVEPKFKIGDRVLLDNYYECVVDDYFDETKSYKLSLLGGGYNIANETRITKK